MSAFKLAYDKTLGHEGGYSFDPNDRGGETYKGISRANFPNWEGWRIIDLVKANVNRNELDKVLAADENLQAFVLDFYRINFWLALKLEKIAEQEIAEELFDTAVNQGLKTAAKYFQQALNLLNNNQKHYSNISEDGNIGDGTIKAYKAYMLTSRFPGRSEDRNIRMLLKVMNGLQFERYADICRATECQEIYLYGWVNRV